MFEKTVDQKLNPVGLAKVSENYTVATEVAEATLENIIEIWDIPNTVESNTGTETLSLGTSDSVTYKSLEFIGEAPEGYDRTFHIYKAYISEVGDMVLQKDDQTVVPVTFTVFADTSKPSGKQIGYIEDATS